MVYSEKDNGNKEATSTVNNNNLFATNNLFTTNKR